MSIMNVFTIACHFESSMDLFPLVGSLTQSDSTMIFYQHSTAEF